ncbi:MAG: transaldolase / glucose-6-phosphate isomerase, partial [Acidobacteriota bacterium]|nr:transaldolase / glucose-6-phosphate isomerase [Acidobacteriota bacterium]
MASQGTELRLGKYGSAVDARLARWQEEGFGRRLWQKDPTLWSREPVPDLVDRLGWLPLPETAPATLPLLTRLTDAVRAEGILHAVVLGMGGSSLAPEVFARTFGHRPGWPELSVLDSTHPDAVAALAGRLDPLKSLFLVSSKSGGTTETMSYFYTFWDRVKRALAAGGTGGDPGRHFVAITDPGTSLEKLARERGFRAVFEAPPDVGGRYSALTPFGLVPAALAGVDLAALLDRARAAATACGPEVPAGEDPGLLLGAALGELARAGRDKLTFWTTPKIRSFPDWLEQLIAESTGKDGTGIVPVAEEPLGTIDSYGADRFFVALEVAGEPDSSLGTLLDALEAQGHPVARLTLADPEDLGREMFRWEVAVAAAGAVLGIHPFNQPDVEFAKVLAKQAMKEAGAEAGTGGGAGSQAVAIGDRDALGKGLADLLGGEGGYVGIHAYLAPETALSEALHGLQGEVRDRTRLATTFGYGPRFLHSTGQLHKGGPAGSRFLQLVDHPHADLPVP